MVGMEQSRQLPPGNLIATLRSAGCVDAEEEAAILQEAAHSSGHLAQMLARRVQGTPLEHIVGWAEFDGTRMAVAAGVFVPRRRSIFLVDRAIAVLRAQATARGESWATGQPARIPVIVDLCCGSGALGAALARRLAAPVQQRACVLHATDIDPAAVDCAARNVAPVNGRAYCGDLFEPLPKTLRGTVDLIIANAPYVPSRDIEFMPREARLHEPGAALNGGADGLDLHRRIARQAGRWLRPGGTLLLECSARQAPAGARILAACGLTSSTAASDEFDCTLVTGTLTT